MLRPSTHITSLNSAPQLLPHKKEAPASIPVSVSNDEVLLGDATRLVNKGAYSDAVERFMALADQGNEKALEKIAEFLKQPPFAQAMNTLLEKQDMQSRPGAAYIRGRMYQEGLGVPQNHYEAFRHFKLSADQKYVPAQYRLGLMYEKGLTIPMDDVQGVRYDPLSADDNYVGDQYNLGCKYSRGSDDVPRDYKKAVERYKLAADQGYAPANYNLGCIYSDGGDGVPRDNKEAVKHYKLAADQDHSSAKENLQWMYKNRRGDSYYEEAVKSYDLAANQGHVRAKFNLAIMYQEGRGVERKMPAQAHLLLLEVAEQQDDLELQQQAQEMIAKLYPRPADLKKTNSADCVVQ